MTSDMHCNSINNALFGGLKFQFLFLKFKKKYIITAYIILAYRSYYIVYYIRRKPSNRLIIPQDIVIIMYIITVSHG